MEKVTAGSVLYPMLALFATLSGNQKVYSGIKVIKDQLLPKCNFQLYYLDETAEEHFYICDNIEGKTIYGIDIPDDMNEFKSQTMEECSFFGSFNNLSAIKVGLWPIILVGCRHYRIPIPTNILLYDGSSENRTTTTKPE